MQRYFVFFQFILTIATQFSGLFCVDLPLDQKSTQVAALIGSSDCSSEGHPESKEKCDPCVLCHHGCAIGLSDENSGVEVNGPASFISNPNFYFNLSTYAQITLELIKPPIA